MTRLFLFATALLLAACARAPAPQADATPDQAAATPPAPLVMAASTRTPLRAVDVLVHKSPTCGCCEAWVAHLRESGFVVKVNDTEAMHPIKARLGVPADKAACHTAEVGGYFVEGHVPASDIRRLLAERPDARGLALPGMPIGSPGMGPPGSGPGYTVELIAKDGSNRPFQAH
jgi:hypothetical protein